MSCTQAATTSSSRSATGSTRATCPARRATPAVCAHRRGSSSASSRRAVFRAQSDSQVPGSSGAADGKDRADARTARSTSKGTKSRTRAPLNRALARSTHSCTRLGGTSSCSRTSLDSRRLIRSST
jgi:hypothetical protein